MMQLSQEATLICDQAIHIHWLKDSSNKPNSLSLVFSILCLLPRPQRNQTNQLSSKIQSNWIMTGAALKFQRDSTNQAISCTKILRNFYLPYMSLSLKYNTNKLFPWHFKLQALLDSKLYLSRRRKDIFSNQRANRCNLFHYSGQEWFEELLPPVSEWWLLFELDERNGHKKDDGFLLPWFWRLFSLPLELSLLPLLLVLLSFLPPQFWVPRELACPWGGSSTRQTGHELCWTNQGTIQSEW